MTSTWRKCGHFLHKNFTSIVGQQMGRTVDTYHVQVRWKSRPNYFAERVAEGPVLRRHGYEEKILLSGPLPRTVKTNTPIKVIPPYKPKESWTEKRAHFGQNDYVDILGPPGALHPAKLMYGVPQWLRGFHGNEMQTLTRQKAFYGRYWQQKQPAKWEQVTKRIRYLYRVMNQKHVTYKPYSKERIVYTGPK
ncbi:unnamed protein product [Darwinula stevensoni]|uniref:Large ribosomal subunit protein mL51 n=1 Tax=Darwinula stevensoni TaxID=69355 RepID=A0A7R8XCI9_9CRUS|nr:unnamed protein product [Darwinula stevensoni]CAG0893378.1 unnamed protein product [Darwinula stevensoni]